MKEIKSWKRSCPSYIVLSYPVNLLFGFFYCWKNFRVLLKNFIFGEKNFRDSSFYYFRRQKLSQKWEKMAKIAKVSAPKVSFTIKNEKDNRMSFPDVNIIREKRSLPLLSTANQLLAEFIPTLIVSYHLVTKSACYRHYYIDVSGFA